MITPLSSSKKLLFLLFFAAFTTQLNAQSTVDKYVDYGLKNNLVLQQKNVSLESAMYSLREARSLFLPSITLLGDYQSGEGGRSIDFPVGDLLNPAYQTLNQLIGQQAFPMLENVNINFLPNNYYDVKLRASMPLFNTDIIYNKKIQSGQVQLKQSELDAYKAELTKEIKSAYYTYLSSLSAVNIYEDASKLASEGKRVNESLAANGKAVKAYVIRSESELQQVEAKRKSAIEQAHNAQLYFNFIINAEASQEIDTTGMHQMDLAKAESYLLADPDISKRSELKTLAQAEEISKNAYKLSSSYMIPKVSGFIDYGSQSADWIYNSETRYYFAGVHLELPLFTSGQNSYKKHRAELTMKNQSLTTDYTTKQIKLAASAAKNNLRIAYENYLSSVKQEESAQYYNRLIQKGYAEGVNSFIESIDARTQLTAASLQRVISQNQLQIATITFERETSNN
ncbi:MAG: TolC family protein [Bacteroidetes bacterium]|nr:TolC family protein [Bacteroidota bacterium]